MKKPHVFILAGGIGSRFWPESRQRLPKQFLDIVGSGKSLLQLTFERFRKITPAENIGCITSTDYATLVHAQLPDMPEQNIWSEPARKNTAPCIAYAAYRLYAQDPDAILVIAPSDHLILDEAAFTEDLQQAVALAAKEPLLLTLGIRPTRPDTGYGYIRFEAPEDTTQQMAYPVAAFTEKPDAATAQRYLASGQYLWNAGIFIWSARTIVAAFQQHFPEADAAFQPLLAQPESRPALEQAFEQCPAISIDYAILEKARNVAVVPANFGWSDLGTWESAYQNAPKDAETNAVLAEKALLEDAHGCLVKAPEGKMVVVKGVKNLLIVDTPDVLMVCDRSLEQEIKQTVAALQAKTGEQYI